MMQIDHDFKQIYDRWRTGEITADKAAKMCGFTKSTFYYRVKKLEAAEDK